MYDALDVIRAHGSMTAVFQAYLGNVPPAQKEDLLRRVAAFEHDLPAVPASGGVDKTPELLGASL